VRNEPDAGVAVNVTIESYGNTAEHVAPQFINERVSVTVPLPEPVLVTVIVGFSSN
jgi:multisubunit Na+/H+ antiporter MnhC subunit